MADTYVSNKHSSIDHFGHLKVNSHCCNIKCFLLSFLDWQMEIYFLRCAEIFNIYACFTRGG